MTHSKPFLDRINSAGWHPDNPCEECRRILKRPPMPADLTAVDRIGVHWLQVQKHLVRRFGIAGRKNEESQATIERIALCHVVRQITIIGELTRERLESAYATVGLWHQESYLPASRRLLETLRTASPNEQWIFDQRPRFEPALTDTCLDFAEGFIDAERDRRTMSLARAMHEQGTLNPTELVSTDSEQLEAYFSLLCDDYPLWTTAADGSIALGPKLVKTALDGTLGRTMKRSDGNREIEGTAAQLARVECDGRNPAPSNALDALSALDAVERVREVIECRLARAKRGTARWWVLKYFTQLAEGEMTFAALAARSELSDSAIHEAWTAERDAVAAALRAA